MVVWCIGQHFQCNMTLIGQQLIQKEKHREREKITNDLILINALNR